MSHETEALAGLKALVFDMSPDNQIKFRQIKDEILKLMHAHGEHGSLAVMMLNLEMLIEMDKRG